MLWKFINKTAYLRLGFFVLKKIFWDHFKWTLFELFSITQNQLQHLIANFLLQQWLIHSIYYFYTDTLFSIFLVLYNYSQLCITFSIYSGKSQILKFTKNVAWIIFWKFIQKPWVLLSNLLMIGESSSK